MAIFSVLNGTGLNGAGVDFNTLNSIAASGIAGFPIITPTTGSVFFNDTGLLSLTGTAMSFIFPSTFGGTVTSLSYSRPAVTPVFSITGMNEPLSNVASGFFGGGDLTATLAAIFAGADTITGSSVTDVLAGFGGADAINGGNGIDTADYSLSASGVVIKLAAGTGSGGDAAGDTLSSIETVIGTAFRDAMAGDGNANTLTGAAGTDVLAGGGGADTLDGGDGIDIVSYSTSLAGVQVDLKNDTYAGGDAAGDSLVGIEYLTGSGFGDTLAGTDGANRLLGLDGDDVLQGNAGNDTLRGGTGGDELDGGDGNDDLIGDADNDTLSGGAGDDRLLGGAGQDALSDGAGRDNLIGGADNDTFALTTLDGSIDAIRDWTAGDKISIEFDTGTVTIGELVSGTDIGAAVGEGIFYNTANGRLYLFDSADGARTLFGVLVNTPNDLAFTDFLIV